MLLDKNMPWIFEEVNIFAPMMKKVLAFLVLLSHMNYAMFIPQLDEVDAYDANGNQVDDINSLTEYIDQIVLGNKDDTPEDEDDDNGFYLNIVKVDQYCFQQFVIELDAAVEIRQNKTKYPPRLENKLPAIFFEIQSPPPEI
jgi:hypothetical protein